MTTPSAGERIKFQGAQLIDQLQHFKSIDLGHLNVKEDKLRLVLHHCFHTFKAIAAFLHDLHLSKVCQVFGNNRAGQGLIINYQDLDHVVVE